KGNMHIFKENNKKPISGNIKISADDFIVEEITNNNTVLEINKKIEQIPFNLNQSKEASKDKVKNQNKFTLFILQKKNWNTIQALTAIAKKFRKGYKSTSFAGTKDRISLSTQLCTIFDLDPNILLNLNIKDIKINNAWLIDQKLSLGDLLGNRFKVTIRNAEINIDSIDKAIDEFGGVFPNFFGAQRFGNRNNNYLIGIEILKGNFENAVLRFLTDTQNELNEDAKNARIRLNNELDFKKALDYFPKYLKYERLVLNYLSKYPTDYANSLRRLPRSLSLIFIHSVESFIFNKELDEIIKKNLNAFEETNFACFKDKHGFPDSMKLIKTENNKEYFKDKNYYPMANIIGYDSKLNNIEKKLLDEFEIELDMFKLKRMPELNAKGFYRVLFSPFFDFNFKINIDQDDHNNNNIELDFSLPKSAYATVFLNQIVTKKLE
ncbi:MAG: tRNA pseudouridine(13) synthase TruD, partial [Candidatus Micrarchaeaceae archaeon]